MLFRRTLSSYLVEKNSMQLSENFYLSEFVKSNTATRLGIDNSPVPEEVENLRLLCVIKLVPQQQKEK